MVRSALRFVFGRILTLFFRRIELAGADRVPRTGPVIFAVNHPNALVDPLLILCFAPRPVSFLAKAPLLTMPVIGWFARALDSIPVFRHQDRADVAQNRETFARARALLDRGGTIAIAPEGTSHSEPSLRPLKTGAARIALGAGTAEPVAIVPVGLFYTEKGAFRSEVLIYFGEPFRVESAPLDERGEPPATAVTRVTDQLRSRLEALVLQADEHQAVSLVARAERLLTATLPDPEGRPLEEIQAVRQALLTGLRILQDHDPAQLARLTRRVGRLEQTFRLSGLDPAGPAPPPVDPAGIARAAGWLLFRVAIFLPLAIPGLVIHWPGYRLIGFLARRYAAAHLDVIATAKIAGAAIVYPITWIAIGVATGRWLGWEVGLAAAIAAPLSGYAALRLVERLDQFLSVARGLGFHLVEPERARKLVEARAALRSDLLALGATLGIESPRRQAGPTTG